MTGCEKVVEPPNEQSYLKGMAFRRLLLPLFLLLLVTGCETPDRGDFPQGAATISIDRAVFGEPVRVGIGQRTEEWELCHPRKGEVAVWIDCSESRERDAHLVSIECDPAEACGDVTFDGAAGSFMPVRERFNVHIVGEIEGARVERSQAVDVESPAIGAHFGPEQAFAEAPVSLCTFGGVPEVDFTVTIDGEVITPSFGDGARSDCQVFVPPSPGLLRAVPRLRDPEVELAAVTATIHPLSDAREVEILDEMCSRKGEVGAYEDPKSGKFFVAVSATAMLDTSATSSQSAGLPASRIKVVVGEQVLVRQGGYPTSASFTLDSAPPAGSRVEIDLDGRIVSVPLRAKQCD
jgi:hypothetical protein